MAYDFDVATGRWRWTGLAVEPEVGQTRAEYLEAMGEKFAPPLPGNGIVPYTMGPGTTPPAQVLPPGDIGVVNGVPISGPFLPEPPNVMVSKSWAIKVSDKNLHSFFVYFWKLIDGRIMCYNPEKHEWKIWRPKKHIVISSDPRMSNIRKLERTYNRVIRKLAKKSKALKLA